MCKKKSLNDTVGLFKAMDRWSELAGLFEQNTPFAFSKLNDGELIHIQEQNVPISRGAQEFSLALSAKLKKCLQHSQENYFVGIPCSKCYPDMHNFAKKHTQSTFLANVLINNNFVKTYELLKKVLPQRRVILVTNEGAQIHNVDFLNPYVVLRVPLKNAWNMYEQYKHLHSLCQPGDVALFCCGPLGRVLVYKWFKHNPRITCIELGSFFDPWFNNRAYSYHTNTLRVCHECNQVGDEDPMKICAVDLSKLRSIERFYWHDMSFENLRNIYQRDDLVYRNYQIAQCFPESSRHKHYYETIMLKLHKDKLNDHQLIQMIEDKLKAYPEWIDCAYELVHMLASRSIKIQYLERLSQVPVPTDLLFLSKDLYTWRVWNDLVVICYYNGDFQGSFNAWTKLMSCLEHIPLELRYRCIDNGTFAKQKLHIDGTY